MKKVQDKVVTLLLAIGLSRLAPSKSKNKTPPGGWCFVFGAGDEARSAAFAADTHTALPTIHRMVSIACGDWPFSPRAL